MKSLLLALALSAPALAQTMIKTGEGIRQKKVAFLTFDVYKITSFVKEAPVAKTRDGLLEANVDKKFELVFQRDVEAHKITESLLKAYKTCDYNDQEKINKMLSVFKADFKKKDKITISYTAADTKTTMTSADGASLAVDGPEIMKATWCIWLGKGLKDEQPKLGDELVKELR